MPLTVLESFRQRVSPTDRWSADEREAVMEELFPEGPQRRDYVWRFTTLIVLSTLIAAFGLLANSAAVVIGAMLVAPLMTPILGVAAAVVHGQLGRLAFSAGLVIGGTILAIFTGAAVSALAPGTVTSTELTSELLARTAPTLLDLGIAVAAGLAAGYVLTHPRAGSSLPGVAIAVALVPPLATVGVALQLGATSEARGALLLYATNLLAIIISAMAMLLFSGFVPHDVRTSARRGVRVGFLITGLLLLAVAVPLAAYTYEVIADRNYTRETLDVINEWDPNSDLVELSADIVDGKRGVVEVTMATSSEPIPAWRLASLLRDRTGLPVTVDVKYQLEANDQSVAD